MAKAKSKPAPHLGKNALVFAGLPGGFKVGGSVFTDENGQPHRRYVKDLVRVGEFFKASTGQAISVGQNDLETLEKSTKRYIANGNKVTLPAGHDTSGNPDKNRGYVTDVYLDGDTLYGVIEAIGEDAIAATSRSHVSIYSPPEWIDGAGNKYEWPIRHVALTADPVLNNQGGFVPIEAAQGDEPVKAEFLTPKTKEIVMDFSALATRLGITDPITEENAVEVIGGAFDALKAKPDANQLAMAQEEVKTLKTRLAAAAPKELSHNERGMAKRLVKSELSNRIKDGNITPVVAGKIEKLLSGSDLMLSFNESGDPIALQFLEALKENDVVKLGEQTGRQVVALSQREAPDEAEESEVETAAAAAKQWAEREFKKSK